MFRDDDDDDDDGGVDDDDDDDSMIDVDKYVLDETISIFC